MSLIHRIADLMGEKSSETKAEAFLRGYLMGLGFDEIVKEPSLARQEDIQEIKEIVVGKQAKEAKAALREIYAATNRAIPEWLEDSTQSPLSNP